MFLQCFHWFQEPSPPVWVRQLGPPQRIVTERGRGFPAQASPARPPTVSVQPVGIHPRFLPLGNNFQEGGTGGPMFSQPLDWAEAIRRNPSVRPRGVRRWGTHTVNLDDLHIHVQIGRMVYGGNRPPGRRDPIDSQRPWKAIEAAFFREVVAIVLQPHLFAENQSQLTPEQCTPDQQPFLAHVDDPNQLATRDVVQHLIQNGVTESWLQLDETIGFACAYLRDWARHQADINTTTNMGQLFLELYPNGIENQYDRQFIEDALTSQEVWRQVRVEAVTQDDDDVPPLEPASPSASSVLQGSERAPTPMDERVDWGV